jgi:pimeloyl-ACP methyl ester carboxylesterase
VAWAPEWDDKAMRGILADPDPAGAGLRMLFPDFDELPPSQQARRRAQGAAFIAEERSVRTGEPPFSLADVKAPVLYGRGREAVFANVVEHLRPRVPNLEVLHLPGAGHHAHRTEPELFADLVRRGVALARSD